MKMRMSEIIQTF